LTPSLQRENKLPALIEVSIDISQPLAAHLNENINLRYRGTVIAFVSCNMAIGMAMSEKYTLGVIKNGRNQQRAAGEG
jgi:hypothetical protein